MQRSCWPAGRHPGRTSHPFPPGAGEPLDLIDAPARLQGDDGDAHRCGGRRDLTMALELVASHRRSRAVTRDRGRGGRRLGRRRFGSASPAPWRSPAIQRRPAASFAATRRRRVTRWPALASALAERSTAGIIAAEQALAALNEPMPPSPPVCSTTWVAAAREGSRRRRSGGGCSSARRTAGGRAN